ncbi:MAG: hypothetical protein PVH47_07095 [Thiohalocapsa sp.]|jgi:antitoxin (DNA-binding transcriptional repressor) of toxin-antitoxin stability system
MTTVTTDYAARHLDELLALVARGETVFLSRDGLRVAMLLPVDDASSAAEVPLAEVEEAFYGD